MTRRIFISLLIGILFLNLTGCLVVHLRAVDFLKVEPPINEIAGKYIRHTIYFQQLLTLNRNRSFQLLSSRRFGCGMAPNPSPWELLWHSATSARVYGRYQLQADRLMLLSDSIFISQTDSLALPNDNLAMLKSEKVWADLFSLGLSIRQFEDRLYLLLPGEEAEIEKWVYPLCLQKVGEEDN